MRRIYSLLLVFLLLMAGCEPTACGCDPVAPGFSESQLLYTWRLDEISSADQVTSRAEAIKDRYTLTFKTQGTYTQKILATGDEFQGSWELINSGHNLKLTDHKGDIQTYDLQGSWPNGGNQPEQISLNRENKDKVWEAFIFTRMP